ncbi:MAG: hypothetical protein AAGB04_12235 [Pseudomonadota bacterium]
MTQVADRTRSAARKIDTRTVARWRAGRVLQGAAEASVPAAQRGFRRKRLLTQPSDNLAMLL